MIYPFQKVNSAAIETRLNDIHYVSGIIVKQHGRLVLRN